MVEEPDCYIRLMNDIIDLSRLEVDKVTLNRHCGRGPPAGRRGRCEML